MRRSTAMRAVLNWKRCAGNTGVRWAPWLPIFKKPISRRTQPPLKGMPRFIASFLCLLVSCFCQRFLCSSSLALLKGDPFEPSNIVVGLVSREADTRDTELGDPFALPSFTLQQAVYELTQLRVNAPDRVLFQLKNQCAIVEVEAGVFRLVHPVHVEMYRMHLLPSGCSLAVVQEFCATERRGMMAENAVIAGLADARRVFVRRVALEHLCGALQRLRSTSFTSSDTEFEGRHMFTVAAETGTGNDIVNLLLVVSHIHYAVGVLEMDIQRGCIGSTIYQHQVKIHPAMKLIPARQEEIVFSAARGLAKAAQQMAAQILHVELHIWYYGEPREAMPDLDVLYRQVFCTRLAALGQPLPSEHPLFVNVRLHQYYEVLDLLSSTLRQEIERVPAPWSW